MARQPHSITYPGKRVRIVLKDGTTFVAKFRARTPKKMLYFDDHDPVCAGDLKSFTIWRNPTGPQLRMR